MDYDRELATAIVFPFLWGTRNKDSGTIRLTPNQEEWRERWEWMNPFNWRTPVEIWSLTTGITYQKPPTVRNRFAISSLGYTWRNYCQVCWLQTLEVSHTPPCLSSHKPGIVPNAKEKTDVPWGKSGPRHDAERQTGRNLCKLAGVRVEIKKQEWEVKPWETDGEK